METTSMKQYNIIRFREFEPKIHESVVITPNVNIIGEVEIGEDSSVWFGGVIRGDVGKITIGKRSNVQDNVTIHSSDNYSVTEIGDDVTIGHNAVVHGAIIKDFVLIGMNSTILDNAVINKNVIVGANAVVLESQVLESGYLYAGIPAKKIKALTSGQFECLKTRAQHYVELSKNYR